MAQSYFPVYKPSAGLPSTSTTSAPVTPMAEKTFDAEGLQEAFVQQKNRIVHAIDESKGILSDLRDFNKTDWIVRYPRFRDAEEVEQDVAATATTTEVASPAPVRPKRAGARRSMSFADDPTKETEVVHRPKKGHSVSLASLKDVAEDEPKNVDEDDDDSKTVVADPDFDFRVLRLDLKLGYGPIPSSSSSTSDAASSLVTQLEKASIANLLEDRIGAALTHVDKLRARVEDTASKVLVTGDLNAGKSTLVNALLRRTVMPVDQQPCTTAFCEVHDAAENGGKEEVHLVKVKDSANYSATDESTFTRVAISDLEEIISENENAQQVVKLYIHDPRSPTESLLNNGIADISLIDAPGLNRDSIKTTALFARQEEIDVVVFVVSAENHFTLSAKEFLQSASKEKAYVFIVVNKFEQIRDKNKCRRLVLDQIKELSPRTYEDAADLVHFVDSSSVIGVEPTNPAFETLESSLRSFVLLKRSKSKLQPAATYLTHLLADVDLLAGSNAILAKAEYDQAKEDLNKTKPILEKMKNTRENLDEGLEHVEEEGVTVVSRNTKTILLQALDKVGSGELAVERPLLSLPPYPGLLRIWEYTRDVRKALLTSLDVAVKVAEDDARGTTTSGVNRVLALGDQYLPEGVERSRRVFMPEAMFSRVRTSRGGRHRFKDTVVAGGLHGLGIGLAQRPELLDSSFLDIFDVHHHYSVYFGDAEQSKKDVEDEEFTPSALSVVSVGVGALTMVGGKVLGARGIVESVVRLTDLFANEKARKWVAPVLGAFTIGLSVYLVLELPNTIPRTVGRRIRSSLIKPENEIEQEGAFVATHAARIARETRKVLRIAGWEQRERFRNAMEERAKEVRVAEDNLNRSGKAEAWFGQVQRRTAGVREEVVAIGEL